MMIQTFGDAEAYSSPGGNFSVLFNALANDDNSGMLRLRRVVASVC